MNYESIRMVARQRYAALLTAVALVLIFSYIPSSFRQRPTFSTYFSGDFFVVMKSPQPMSLEDAINSATGTLFMGEKIRTFEDERFFDGNHRDDTSKMISTPGKKDSKLEICTKWNVVTTIFAPSEAVKRAAKVTGWCTVIVADTKTPPDYMIQAGLVGMETTVHFLSVSDQQAWLERESHKGSAVGGLLAAIPYKHFARKNVGYLYAIQHGAKLIFDFDDDNLLPLNNSTTGKVYPPLIGDRLMMDARMVVTGPVAFNHHPLMGATVTNSWARGFPLQLIQDNKTHGQIAYEDITLNLMESVAVMQFCANGNPDVDAIHRLVHPLPMTFGHPEEDPGNKGSSSDSSPESMKGPLVVPSHAFAPYNAQATIHTHKALWALLLPFTVPGRVSDIWRGYFAEALFRDLALSVTFLPPAIVQDRNEHHNLADMEAELDLYFKGGKLIEFLSGWDSPTESVPERMEALWIDLYERGYIELNDVRVVQLWLAALVEIGYEFPPMLRHRLDHTVLMGQFNHATLPTKDILFWHQKWRQWFNRIVVRGPFQSTQILELQQHGIEAFESRDDSGWYSPIENLAATLQSMKDIESVTGVLYVHDDMLLNVTKMFQNFQFGSQIVTTIIFTTHRPDFHSYTIKPDGTYVMDGANVTAKKILSTNTWFHTQKCMDGFDRLRADPRSKVFLDKDGSMQVQNKGQSDVLYVPTKVAEDFANMAKLIVKHKVFLECGLPKIVEVISQTSNVTIDSVSLCTSWGNNRGSLQMLQKCRFPSTTFHPIKLGSTGLSDWNRAFEWATMGKSPFKA